MHQLAVENIEIFEKGLDDGPKISGIEDAGAMLRRCILAVLMSNPANIPRKLANFESVIGYVREAREALDKAVGDLDHEPTGDALGYATEMMTGLDTTLITLEHLSRTLQAATNQAAVEQTVAIPRPKPLLHVCPECELAFLPNSRHSHECDGWRNGYQTEDLEDLLGPDGFVVEHPDEPPEAQDATANGNGEPPSEPVDWSLPRYEPCLKCGCLFETTSPHFCGDHDNEYSADQLDAMHGEGRWLLATQIEGKWVWRKYEKPVKEVSQPPATPRPEPIAPAPATRGMRDGSKKHRIYIATRKLLETNGQMHIDDMLKSMTPDLFSGVSNPRANFANMLSAFRSNGLVLSDNKGNYRLPNGKAAA